MAITQHSPADRYALLDKPVLSVNETSYVLDQGRQTTYSAIRAGEIEAFKIRRKWIVPSASLRRKLGLASRPDVAEVAA